MAAHSHKSFTGRKALSSKLLISLASIVLPLVLLAASITFPENFLYQGGRTVVNVCVLPLRALGTAIQAPFLAFGQTTQDSSQTQESYAYLREENEKLKAENAELNEKAHLLEQLQALLNFKDNSGMDMVSASVVGRDVDSLTSSITINQGANAGIEVGMAVTDGSGIIGQVMSVDALTSTVRLVSDERSSISAFDQQSRSVGQIEGTGSDTVRMTHVPISQSISVGDSILTSGLGGAIPKGLMIGTVTSVDKTQGSQYYTILVKLASNPMLVENVSIITSGSSLSSSDSL